MKSIDKYRGCLIGGAVGDALGYSVEFLDDSSIFKKYGENGITDYDLVNGVAQISDDTQMTLFTANGLLVGTTRGMTRGIMGLYPSYISLCYQEWYRTQTENFPLDDQSTVTWLKNVPELFNCRAPGNTCLTAIEQGANGTIDNPINHSKGCGGMMRVAPIGLYFADEKKTIEEINMIGAETAALTHGHELGYISAAAFVHIIHLVSHSDEISLFDAVVDMKKTISRQFATAKHISELIQLIDKAIELSTENTKDLEAIRELGEGWVAEETLAIAIYCALKYHNDFEKCMIASVNHSGDSDSCGAVAGNILGAYLGYSAIPEKYLTHLELKDVIIEMADDLYNDCKISEYSSHRDELWEAKYIYRTYKPECREREEKECNIILFPDFQKLKDEVEQLRVELSMLVLERDELQFVQCKNIEMEYMLKLGSLEYKAYEAQCTALRLKRKMELIQAKINRQEKIFIPSIEEILDVEFAEFIKKLNEQVEKMSEAIERNRGEVLSVQETKELKKLYRKIIKNLHPDVHPDITQAQEKLFKNAVEAYKNGDLNTLRIISEMLGEPVQSDEKQDVIGQLASEKERLENMLALIRESIKKIKSEYPYTVKDIIEDPEKTNERKKELEHILTQYQELIEEYTKRMNEMLR